MLKLKKVLCGAVAVMIAGMPFFANAEVNMSAAGDDGKIHIYGLTSTKAQEVQTLRYGCTVRVITAIIQTLYAPS